MPSKPSKGKSPPNSDPACQIGPMMQEFSLPKAKYSYPIGTTSDGISSNYIMITQLPDTPAT